MNKRRNNKTKLAEQRFIATADGLIIRRKHGYTMRYKTNAEHRSKHGK